jgi:hypothetical protein
MGTTLPWRCQADEVCVPTSQPVLARPACIPLDLTHAALLWLLLPQAPSSCRATACPTWTTCGSAGSAANGALPCLCVPRVLARPSRTVDARGRTLTPIPRVVPTAAVRRPTFTVYDRQIAGSGTHGSRGDLSAAAASSRRGARTGSAAATGAPAGSRKRWAFRILFQLPTGQVGSEQRAARARPALVVFGIESPVVCA